MKRWRRFRKKVRRALRGAQIGWGDKPVITLFRMNMYDDPHDLRVFQVRVGVSSRALRDAQSDEDYAKYLAEAIRDQCLVFFGRSRIPNV